MGVTLSDVFADATRQIRRSTRLRIFAEHHKASVHYSLAFALVSVGFVAADWAIDAAHIKSALALRALILAALLLSTGIKWRSQSLYASYFSTYLSLLAAEVLLTVLLARLNGGMLTGAGEFMYLIIGSVLLGMGYPFTYNVIGSALLLLIPQVSGYLIHDEFQPLLYASILLPVGIIAILAHWKIRAFMLENVRNRQELEASALTDPATGLGNVRALEQSFRRLAKLATAKPLQQFMLFIDIDGLGEIKAAYGNAAADALRVGVAEIIHLSFRERDIVASSDDEFVGILVHVSREEAFDIAERFRITVAEKEFNLPTLQNRPLKCTVSIGIVYADTKEQVRTLLNYARVGASQAKAMGGNQSVCL